MQDPAAWELEEAREEILKWMLRFHNMEHVYGFATPPNCDCVAEAHEVLSRYGQAAIKFHKRWWEKNG